MEDLEPQTNNTTFLNHLFNFDNETKNELLNISQYSLLAILPIIVVNKLLQNYIPEVDENKQSLEILVEVIAQTIVIFISIFFIHRLITYFPTFSGSQYGNMNLFSLILGFLVIVLSLQTKLGEKVDLLYNRGQEFIFGTSSNNNQQTQNQHRNTSVTVKQPIKGMQHTQQQQPSNNNVLPPPEATQNHTKSNPMGNISYSPDFDKMYQDPMTNMVNNTHQQQTQNLQPQPQENIMEPMAANEALGGFASF